MPSAYHNMDRADLEKEIAHLEEQVEELRSRGLHLDMARGKPSPEQVDFSRNMLDGITSVTDFIDDGVDAANYGAPDGLPSARALGAELLGVSSERVTAAGSSSLNLMFDAVSHAWVKGIRGHEPWSRQDEVKFLCPSPGYDRHFAVSAHFGIHNVAVRMTDTGPDMDEVVRLVESDASVKGIWCVPKYSNPTGVTYSDETVRAFVNMKPAAPDFRVFWDNAYIVHDLEQPGDTLLNIFELLDEAHIDDRVYGFASTAKITFPGSGIAWICASEQDMVDLRSSFALERVCPNKLSQLLHTRYLKDASAIGAHMARHAEILRPRFELVESKLTEALEPLGCASWSHPKGGYFVSFDGPQGSARAIVSLAAELGVKMTDAGATWPYGEDPADTNIRIAPTYPSTDELSQALDVFVVCVQLVSARLALADKK